MDGVSFPLLLELASRVGLPGVLMVIWWMSDRAHARHMEEIRRMYERNVRLVEAYEALCRSQQTLAQDLKDVIMLNTQSNTHLADAIAHNQFCPMVRREQGSRI
jgi:hypothetical protein